MVCLRSGLWGIGLLIVAAGCSRGDGRVAVSGTVTLDGAPLASGAINFRPAEGLQANSAGARIENGRFELPADAGLLPGTYTVVIMAMKETGRMVDDEQRGKIPETVPVKFRESGRLTATIEPGRHAHCDFQLTSAN